MEQNHRFLISLFKSLKAACNLVSFFISWSQRLIWFPLHKCFAVNITCPLPLCFLFLVAIIRGKGKGLKICCFQKWYLKWRYLTSRNRFQCYGRWHGRYDCRRCRKRGSRYFKFIYFLQMFILTSETWASDISADEKYVYTDILNEISAFTSGYSRIVAYPVKGGRMFLRNFGTDVYQSTQPNITETSFFMESNVKNVHR